jgi:DNA-binding MarR family transcriptional regulator
VLVFGGPATLSELATAEQVSAPTMSKLVRGLERDGLVEREVNERDGRSVVLRATDEGTSILHEGRARRVAELSALLEDATDEELATLESAVAIVQSALARPPSA